jgi:hypothetical protein
VQPPGGIPTSSLQTALDNWSLLNGRYVDCFGPTFDVIASTGEQINLDYRDLGMIGNRTVRGQVDIDGALYRNGRIFYVDMAININLTNPDTITELLAHEIGHLQALEDCTACPVHSSVMVSEGNVQNLNDSTGLPGPTNCDIAFVVSAVTEYGCPFPTPTPDPEIIPIIPCPTLSRPYQYLRQGRVSPR